MSSTTEATGPEEGVVTIPRRVLIVDDSDLVRSALRELVDSDLRFEVVAFADSVDSAVAAAREVDFHVALVDVRMPGGGPAAVRGLLTVVPSAVIVACSAYDDRVSREQMTGAGADAYLVKGRDDVIGGLAAALALDGG